MVTALLTFFSFVVDAIVVVETPLEVMVAHSPTSPALTQMPCVHYVKFASRQVTLLNHVGTSLIKIVRMPPHNHHKQVRVPLISSSYIRDMWHLKIKIKIKKSNGPKTLIEII